MEKECWEPAQKSWSDGQWVKDVNELAKLNAPSKGMGQESMRKVGRFQDNMVLMVSEKLPVSSPHT